MGLLSYQTMPLPWCGMSPAELLMGRRIQTDVPQIKDIFIPDWSHLKEFEEKEKEFKQKQKEDYDRRHRVRDLSPILDGTSVWVNTCGTRTSGRVTRLDTALRSYWLQTPSGEVRCNRRDVIIQPQPTESQESTLPVRTLNVIATQSRTETTIRPPKRLTY